MDWGSAIFDGAVEAARAALARLDHDGLSPALRRVDASSARSLPPPLRATLGKALEQEPWLRLAALEALRPGDEAGRLALERPDGWEAHVRRIESEWVERADVRATDRDVQALRARVASLETAIVRLREGVGEEGREIPPADTELLDRLRRSNQRLRSEKEALEGRVELLGTLVERWEQDLTEADRRIDRLRRSPVKIDRARIDRADSEGRMTGPMVVGSGDPIGLARSLDHLFAAQTRHRSETATSEPDPIPDLSELISAIAPDRPEALRALAAAPQGFTLAIDGWNVAFRLMPDPGPLARARVEAAAAHYRRIAVGPVHPIVVWDTASDPGAERRRAGVDVRFASSADDALVVLSERLGPRCVVVTSDAAVRTAVNAHGGLAIWSEAFVAWDADPHRQTVIDPRTSRDRRDSP